MNKNVCQNCKFWTREIVTDPNGRFPAIEKNFGKCNHVAFVYDSSDSKTPVNGLCYSDYEGFDASFVTGPKFGCIHFSSK